MTDIDEIKRRLDEYFPTKKRFVSTKITTNRFNIIGFGSEDIVEYKQCPLDPGIRLEKIKGELRCPKCGYTYRKEETVNEESVKVKHLQQKPAIISARKKKKHYFDKQGNEINPDDKDIMNLIAQGYQIKYYHEQKSGEEKRISNYLSKITR